MRNIGQMVTETLQIRHKIDEHTAALRLTYPAVQTVDMAINQLLPISVDFFFFRIESRHLCVVFLEDYLFHQII